MKRAIIATVLGLAASVVSSYGQASYFFDTYSPQTVVGGGQVMWSSNASLAPAGLAGTQVLTAQGFTADLLWQVGATTGDLGLSIPTYNSAGFGNGFIFDQTSVSFDPAYAGGPITFTINVGNGVATGTETWTEPGMGAGNPPVLFSALPQVPIVVSLSVPEPTTLALAGLGAAGMLLFRKRQ